MGDLFLLLPREKYYCVQGVSCCVTCDGVLYQDRNVDVFLNFPKAM